MGGPFGEEKVGDESSAVDTTKKYPDAKEVAKFHRNSDRDKSQHAIHHTLGSGRYQAARGDHIHDGDSGTALLDMATYSGNVNDLFELGEMVRSLSGSLADNIGATDSTTRSGETTNKTPLVTVDSLRELLVSGVGGSGPKGDTGAPGADSTVPGPKGDKGDKGNTGATGAIGPQGPQGPQGPKGEQGIQGIQGEQGVKGDTGLTGEKGNTGSAGLNGTNGTDGEDSTVPGPKGDKGNKGDQGTGLNLETSVANEAALPSTGNTAGDGRITNDTGHLWTWDGMQWNDAGLIQGPEGDQGIQGEQGIQGPKGNTGAKGAKGDQGPQGIQGIQGPKGNNGTNGTDGVDGDTGPKGDTGAKGDKGNTGATGAAGADGVDGVDGVDALNTKPTQHYVGTSGEPGFRNSWSNYNSGFGPASFYKEAGGVVHISGLIKGGNVTGTSSAGSAFILPLGFRPAESLMFTLVCKGITGSGKCTIASDGYVVITYLDGNNGYVSLDGITFLDVDA